MAKKSRRKSARRPNAGVKTRNRASTRALSRRTRNKRVRGNKEAPTILLTGFGPFPGAPFNPSAPLAETLARTRRQMFSGAKLVCHVFATSYNAVDRELPVLIARHRPDAVIMFGLATRSKHLRIETLARNAVSAAPDADGFSPGTHAIARGRGQGLAIRAPRIALLHAARSRGLPARLSRDAGRYVCNYLYWRALEAAGKPRGPKLAVFVHVPAVRPNTGLPRRRTRQQAFILPELVRSAEALLVAALASLKASG